MQYSKGILLFDPVRFIQDLKDMPLMVTILINCPILIICLKISFVLTEKCYSKYYKIFLSAVSLLFPEI